MKGRKTGLRIMHLGIIKGVIPDGRICSRAVGAEPQPRGEAYDVDVTDSGALPKVSARGMADLRKIAALYGARKLQALDAEESSAHSREARVAPIRGKGMADLTRQEIQAYVAHLTQAAMRPRRSTTSTTS
jgi:hypothetical protein